MKLEYFFGAVVFALIGVVAWLLVHSFQHTDQLNRDFKLHCDKLGGYAVIEIPKDVCLSPEVVLDHE